ncbi:MAG TPA: TraB/GumN family protein [Saprospiraceae bacterium]|nr:TraB/GumN family protein [Saprospiraceae bacterium]HMP24956.1 TraB/GumN family protein [Saprospiraceae bacterium]
MKKVMFLFAAILLYLTVQPTFAQSDNTLLWEISGKGLKQPSYLFGTFHVLCPEDLMVTDAIRNKLKMTKQLVLELDFDDPNLMTEMQQYMVLTNGKTTKDYLNESDYELVSRFFQDSLGMPFEQVAIIKPFMLTTFLYTKYLGCQPASWEQVLVQMAQAQKSEILGLETPQQQLAALDKMTYEQQAALLVEGVRDYDKMKIMMAEMVQIYKDQKMERIQESAGTYFAELEAIEKALLEDRNRKWIPQIEKLIKKNPTFFAVGAAHLGGKTGVIALLRAKGYKLTPIANVDEQAAAAGATDDFAALLVRKWRMDESVVPQALEDVLENVRNNNPEQAAMLEAQKGMIADGLRAATVEYKANGRYEMLILGQRMSGVWRLSDDGKQLLRTDDGDGEESVNEIVEVNNERLVLINSKQKQLIYVPK